VVFLELKPDPGRIRSKGSVQALELIGSNERCQLRCKVADDIEAVCREILSLVDDQDGI